MHIQRGRWILVTLLCAVFTSASGSTVHQSDGASKHTFCRIHGKMELCNYHWGQHCGGDCFQIDCAHGPSSRTFPPIIFLLAFRWNLRLLESLILYIHSFWKSVRNPVDGLFKIFFFFKIDTENWETVLDFSHFGSRSVVVSIIILSFTGLSVLACSGIFPVIKKSIQGIGHSSESCRRRRLWICKHFSWYTMRIHIFGCKSESLLSNPPGSRGRRNNAGCLGTWNNYPQRTDSTSLNWFSTNFLTENSSSRNSCSLFNSSNFWILRIRVSRSARSRSANSSWSGACSRLDCSYPVRVRPIFTAWESICLFFSQILFSARSALYSCLRISDFASASNCSLVFPKMILNWQLSNSWLDLRFCDIQFSGLSVLAKQCMLKQAWVINLQQARTCFSLLKVQWWSQRIPGVLVVNLSIWVLRVVVANDVDCLDIRALEEWRYFLKVFSQFSSWKFLDLSHVNSLQFFPWFLYGSLRTCSCEKGLSW